LEITESEVLLHDKSSWLVQLSYISRAMITTVQERHERTKGGSGGGAKYSIAPNSQKMTQQTQAQGPIKVAGNGDIDTGRARKSAATEVCRSLRVAACKSRRRT
jgi:hypothetical protein